MKSPCFFVEIFAEKRREVCLMPRTGCGFRAQGRWRAERKKAA